MKKWLALALAALLSFSASAETLPGVIPESAVVEQVDETSCRVTMGCTGEVLLLTLDSAGNPLRLETEIPALSDAEGEQSREEAELALLAEYPTARVLSAELNPDGSRVLAVLADDLCGTVTVHGGKIISRALDFGEYALNDRLTSAGALAALSLLRPEAQVVEIELDEDDGVLLYEGEAFISGVEYEFELHARTGKLLEWERD